MILSEVLLELSSSTRLQASQRSKPCESRCQYLTNFGLSSLLAVHSRRGSRKTIERIHNQKETRVYCFGFTKCKVVNLQLFIDISAHYVFRDKPLTACGDLFFRRRGMQSTSWSRRSADPHVMTF